MRSRVVRFREAAIAGMGMWSKALKGLVIASMLGGLTLSYGQEAYADSVYTYKDEAASFKINGSQVRMSGEHVVWRGRGADGSGPAGQIHYGNMRSGLTVAVTSHGNPTDTPSIGVNTRGEAIVVWVDRRDFANGTGDMNWDIYSYNTITKIETKLNTTVALHRAPLIDGSYIVWQTNPRYDMHLYNMESRTLTELGRGRDPVISNGLIVYKGAEDGDLYEYKIADGTHRKILDLPYSQFVDRFVFNGEQILWKQRDQNRNIKYTFMDLSASNPQPVDLTAPVKPEVEYSHMSISSGKAVWMEESGGATFMKGADLSSGDVFSLGAARPQDLIGFNGNELTIIKDGSLVNRIIVETEVGTGQPSLPAVPPSKNTDSGQQPQSIVIGPDGGQITAGEAAGLSFGLGTFKADTSVTLENHSEAELRTKGKQVKGMVWAGAAWKWTAEAELMKPATFTIALERPVTTADQASQMGMYRYDEQGDNWVYAGGTADSAWRMVSASVKQPGLYALFAYEPSFPDMNGHWAKREVEVLAARWIVNGMATGSFEPKQSVTRAQFAKMLVQAAGLAEETAGTGTFKDVPSGHWAAPWIEQAAAAGWIRGYEGGLFKPNAEVTREQMMVMLANAAELKQEASGNALAGYADAGQVSPWARLSIEAVIKSGIVQGGGGRLHPGATSTRAEAAAVIYRWLAMKGEVFSG